MFLSITLWCIMGACCAYYAQMRGRDPILWCVLGTLLGVIGLVILYFLPPLEQKAAPEEAVEIPAQQPDQLPNLRFKEWFYLDQAYEQKGPISFLALQRLIDQGSLSTTSLVWSEGMQEWKPISAIPDLNA